jgi:DtxR family manganese transport transcriptional regulator
LESATSVPGGNALSSSKRASIPMNSDATRLDEAVQTRRFVQARAARSASILEDYAELIADLFRKNGEARIADIARALGVTGPTAVKAIARLKREGLAVSRPYRGIFLTEAGSTLANRVRDRHRLVVDVLTAIGVPKEAAEADAEGIEHYVSRETLMAFERYLRRNS